MKFDYLIPQGLFKKQELKKGDKDISFRSLLSKFLNILHIPFYDDCCPSTSESQSPVRMTEGLEYFDGTSWIPVPSSGGGGSFALESYQNSAMSVPVDVYVQRAGNNDILKIYEPVRNNEVRLHNFDDNFQFDNINWIGNTLNDVDLKNIPTDAILQDCDLENMVINVNNNNAFQMIGHTHVGNNGLDFSGNPLPHNAEIYVVGNGVTLRGNRCDFATCFDSLGDSSNIVSSEFAAASSVKISGSTAYTINRVTLGVFSYISATTPHDNFLITATSINSDGGIEVVADNAVVNWSTFETDSYITIGSQSILHCNFRESTVIDISGTGDQSYCTFGAGIFYNPIRANTNFNLIQFSSSTTDPTTADIPDGTYAIEKNSVSGDLKLWANDGGTLKSITLT